MTNDQTPTELIPTDPTPTDGKPQVDMSSAAITHRLKLVSEMKELGRSLRNAKDVGPVKR